MQLIFIPWTHGSRFSKYHFLKCIIFEYHITNCICELTWESGERLDCCSWVALIGYWSSLPVLNKELQKMHLKTCSRLPLNISECSNSWCKFNHSLLSKVLSHSEQAKHSGEVHLLSPGLCILCASLSEFGSCTDQNKLHTVCYISCIYVQLTFDKVHIFEHLWYCMIRIVKGKGYLISSLYSIWKGYLREYTKIMGQTNRNNLVENK